MKQLEELIQQKGRFLKLVQQQIAWLVDVIKLSYCGLLDFRLSCPTD